MDFPAITGALSAALFAAANLPMLHKAIRTRDVRSYSRSALLLTMAANLLYTPYVLSMPAGPIWALHLFYTVSTGVILTLSLAPSRRRNTGDTMSHASGGPARGGASRVREPRLAGGGERLHHGAAARSAPPG